jgi:monoamine oxidase
MQRRKFLRQIGYSLPAALAFPAIVSSCKKEDDVPSSGIQKIDKYKNYEVIVIGAGASGLYTGWYLQERGFKVTVLEASGQIGGRIRHLKGFTDFDIELGAEEIHGSLSPWYDIVNASGAEFMTSPTQDFYYFKQDFSNPNEKALKSEAEALQYNQFIKAKDFIDRAYAWSGADATVEQQLAAENLWEMFGVVNGMLSNEHGTSNDRLSLKGLAAEDVLWSAGEGNFKLKDRTMLSILEEKFASILGKVELNRQVKNINYSGQKTVLTDQTGKTWQADRVVITVPMSILRDGDISFTPALPSTKQDAFQNVGMGAGMKALFKFSQPFWEDLDGLVANVGSIFGNNDVPEIYISSYGRGNIPVITASINGFKAEQFSQLGSGAAGTILANLDNIFATGNVASSSLLQNGSYIMDWSKEPFIKGAYSFPKVGGSLIFRKELASPVGEQLFFAGEATHFKGHSGTVHGAIESGIRVAQEIEDSIA